MSRQCSIEDCGRPYYARGLCTVHYARLRKHGDPHGGRRRAFNGETASFLEKAIQYQGTDCLAWPFCRKADGRGEVWFNGRLNLVHRVVCELVHGPAPTPKHVARHHCGKGHEGCCSPKHLAWGTPTENEADKLLHGTHNRGERNGQVKLTESDVRTIRALRGRKLQREVAAMFGINRTTVGQVQNGDRWGWLDHPTPSARPTRQVMK